MESEQSVSHWLVRLKAGDPDGAQRLWERYFAQLVRFARARLRGMKPRRADEEDVALSAFASFCRLAEAGRFPKLTDRDDLWRLLVAITARKSYRLLRDENRQKRGGLAGFNHVDLESLIGDVPTPEFAAQCAEECRTLLDLLRDDQLAKLALWKMEGFTNDEIASQLDCTPRT